MAGPARTLLRCQFVLCEIVDRLLPEQFRVDGHKHYLREFVWEFIRPGMMLYDIGGGKHPLVSIEQKRGLGLKVCGLDIDACELDSAPVSSYAEVVCADITDYEGKGERKFMACSARRPWVTAVPETRATATP
jgi:hypothetical protein